MKLAPTIERGTKEPPSFPKRILVVDDDPNLTLTFKVGLELDCDNDERKFEVYTYNNPLEALSEFKPHFYDLLLTDIYMPDMNGYELFNEIRKVNDKISMFCHSI